MSAGNDSEAPLRNPMVAQADRTRMVNVLIVLVLAAVAWESWPTEARKLRQQADEYAAAQTPRLEVGDVQVDPGNATATVLLSGRKTRWVRVDGKWRIEAGPGAKARP